MVAFYFRLYIQKQIRPHTSALKCMYLTHAVYALLRKANEFVKPRSERVDFIKITYDYFYNWLIIFERILFVGKGKTSLTENRHASPFISSSSICLKNKMYYFLLPEWEGTTIRPPSLSVFTGFNRLGFYPLVFNSVFPIAPQKEVVMQSDDLLGSLCAAMCDLYWRCADNYHCPIFTLITTWFCGPCFPHSWPSVCCAVAER